MKVIVNGVETALDDEATVSVAVGTLTGQTAGVAVALNGEVVSRSAWSSTRLSSGDQVEVLTAVQGG
ncbi:sulfur carrier protein ThiS [Sphaerimonospora thailandensis]|uniref:Thiamine biosynthesis protein ThiS n=1 Tax=Sphaerimonospora thailandensis TaxID=795644 RepID=A0A8J3R2X7_9ACTN|nr:sulfur carrier protein ThiS [Sphaerimonospora thailandensis]GIH68156.1 thiamine biosynthesis protein ThiS [Sphaerimonospora thailandensis]